MYKVVWTLLKKLHSIMYKYASLEEHLFANQVPAIRDKVMKAMLKKESLLVRKKTIPRVIDKIMDFIDTFIDGIAA